VHFGLPIQKNKTVQSWEQCLPIIKITQHNRSLIVLQEIQTFLGYGKVVSHSQSKDASNFKIASITEINIFIKLFKEAKITRSKSFRLCRFFPRVWIINKKAHLDQAGLAEISAISQDMNAGRTTF
jgi:LAGLIDADG endonuclease